MQNYSLSVELQNYAIGGDLSGFGDANVNDVNTLMKSITAGNITGRTTEEQGATGGSVLKVESLEQQLKVLDFREQEIVLWKKIPKLPAYNTVEEYIQLKSYGSFGNAFNNEGELPEEDDTQYARKSQLVKFMGKTGSVSHPAQLVNMIQGVGNITEHKVKATTMTLLREADLALVAGDSAIIPQQWNGLYAQHKTAIGTGNANNTAYFGSSVVIDLKGKALTETAVAAAQLSLINNHGIGTLLMGPPSVLSDYATRFLQGGGSATKFVTPGDAGGMETGQRVTGIMTQFGPVELGHDLFMSNQYAGGPIMTSASAATNLKAPAAPSVSAAVVSDTATNYNAYTGNYVYCVTAVNRYGESAPTITGTLGVTSNTSIALTITAGVSTVPATGFKIYKSMLNAVTGTVQMYYLFSVSTTDVTSGYDGGAAGVVWDRGWLMANTEQAFLTDPTLDIYSFKQLAPVMKMDLAPLGPATRYMVLMYGTPILYQPLKFIHFINIGHSLS